MKNLASNFWRTLFSITFLSFFFTTNSQTTLCSQFGQEPFGEDVIINDPNQPNPTTVTYSSSLNTDNWTNQKIKIYNTFIVDDKFTIDRCTLKMMQDSKVEIQPNNQTFVVNFSKFFSDCSTTWNGLSVPSNAKGHAKFSFNTFEDARPQVIIINSADLSLNFYSNQFNRNLFGVVSSGIALNALFTANKFDCTSPINGTSDLYSQFAIKLTSNGVAAIGGNGGILSSPNKFYHHHTGIYDDESIVDIGWSDFRYNTSGIYANKGTCKITGNTQNTTKKSTFLDNGQDIFALSSSLYATNCKFDRCLGSNISSKYNNIGSEIVNIYNNEFIITDHEPESFLISKIGIDLDRTRGSSNAMIPSRNSISSNNFTINNFRLPVRSAIKVTGFSGTDDDMNINYNNITVGTGGLQATPTPFVEINIGAAHNFKIQNNTLISFNTLSLSNGLLNKNRWGFYIHDGESTGLGHAVYENKVFGNATLPDFSNTSNDPFDGGTCAFHHVNTNTIEFCNNITDNTLRGCHFMGDCGKSYIYLNKILNHTDGISDEGDGLLLQAFNNDSGEIGTQNCANNTWLLTDYSPSDGAEFTSPNSGNIIDNQFMVKINTPGQLPNPFTPNGTPPLWFTEVPCSFLPSSCGLSIVGGDTIDQDEKRLIIKFFDNGSNWSDAFIWDKGRQLLTKLLRYPNLISTPLVDSFYNSQINSSPGLFAQFSDTLYKLETRDSIDQNEIISLEIQIDTNLNYITLLDLDLKDSIGVLNADTTFFHKRKKLLSQVYLLNEQIAQLKRSILIRRATNMLICSKINDDLPKDSIFEQNQQFLNSLEIKHTLGLELDSSDWKTLRYIANQCPILGGRTRDRAIGWLPLEEAMTFRSEDPQNIYCDVEERKQRNDDVEPNSNNVTVYPNPSSNGFTIGFEKPTNNVKIEIRDVTSSIVYFEHVKSSIEKKYFETTGWQKGVYFISISAKDINFNAKIIIL